MEILITLVFPLFNKTVGSKQLAIFNSQTYNGETKQVFEKSVHKHQIVLECYSSIGYCDLPLVSEEAI